MKLLPLALLALGSTLSLGCTVTTRQGPPPPRYRQTYVSPSGPARPVYVAPAGPAQGYNGPAYTTQPAQPVYNQPAQAAQPAQPDRGGRPAQATPPFYTREPERAPHERGTAADNGGRPTSPIVVPASRPGQPSNNGRPSAPEDPGNGRTPGTIQLPDRR